MFCTVYNKTPIFPVIYEVSNKCQNVKWQTNLNTLLFDINCRTRVVLVLALPPPHLSSPVDLDLLDCLQQEAVSPMVPPSSSGCGGPIKLPHCTPKPQEKADKVFMRCGGETSKIGVAVICWGCSVWHR